MIRTSFGRRSVNSQSGFSFIEIALALVIIGILTGAGLLLLGKTVESSQRKESLQRLLETKTALLFFAKNQGKLPIVTNYYQKIGSSPVDVWQKSVNYIVSSNVTTPTLYDICGRTKNPVIVASWIALDDQIEGENYVASGSADREKTIVALLYSRGARDASEDNSGTALTTTYKRNYPSETFDDLVVAITAEEMYNAIRDNFCMATVTVTDSRTIGDFYYIYNRTALKDIGSANWLEPTLTSTAERTITAKVLFGEQIEIRDAAGGGGNLIPANVPTPVTIIANPTAISTLP